MILSHERLQPLGYLAWAACGKDPGFSPASILEQAGRASRYAAEELEGLAFAGGRPDAADLARRWHTALAAAQAAVRRLPADAVGTAVLTADGELFHGRPEDIADALGSDGLTFHRGRIRGAYPRIRPEK